MRRQFFTDSEGFSSFFKDKDTIRDYAIDWTRELDGSTILTSVWESNGVTIESSSNTSNTTVVNIGNVGGVGDATNTITLTNGLVFQKTLRFYEAVK